MFLVVYIGWGIGNDYAEESTTGILYSPGVCGNRWRNRTADPAGVTWRQAALSEGGHQEIRCSGRLLRAIREPPRALQALTRGLCQGAALTPASPGARRRHAGGEASVPQPHRSGQRASEN